MKHELSLNEAETLTDETLESIGRNLGTDFVVTGSFFVDDDNNKSSNQSHSCMS